MKDTKKADANRDPITCEPGAHPVGTGIGAVAGGAAGAAAGAATGAAAGTAAGPVGTGIGLAAGAVIGGLAGKAGGEATNPTHSPDLGRFIDYTVYDRNNEKVGSVDSVWQDASGQPAYLAVRTGWLGMGKAHVVPVHSSDVNEKSKRIRLPFTVDQVKNAPDFDCTADLDEAAENKIGTYYGRYGYSAQPAPAPVPEKKVEMPREKMTGRDEARVQLKEEELKVGKREVEYGGVRLRKIVRTETVQQPVQLMREEIVVERVPVQGQTGESSEANFAEEEIYVPLRREEAVIQKEAHVREEVRVGKRDTREEETVSETVRKEDVEIEKTGLSDSRISPSGTRGRTQKYEPKERSRTT